MTKEQLLAEVARSRSSIARDYSSVRREFDVQAKVNQLVRRKPLAWLGGAAALGWLLSGPKTKTRVVTRFLKADGKPSKRVEEPVARLGFLGVLLAVIKFSLPLLKPVLTAYAGKRFADLAAKLAK
ncbi:MAG: hypothetical protein ACOYMS_05680 [Terrimicrobiaceae bacterium]